MAKISWAGESCFSISVSHGKDHSADIVINPVGNASGDIVLMTEQGQSPKGVKGTPFVINGPGEYEIKEVFIQGISAGPNTIYVFEAEQMRFCHLGNFDQAQLTDEQLEKIDRVDILMVPAEAAKVVGQIDPKIVIPMMHSDASKFLKTMGKSDITPVDKLTIKAKELPKEGATQFVVLTP